MEQTIKKGYTIDFNKIDEGYLSSGEFCSASSRNKAKVMLLQKIEYSDWTLLDGRELNYLNIPVIRDKDFDTVNFNGKEVTRIKAIKLQKEIDRNNRLKEILEDNKIKYCYITKHGSYYLPKSNGYTYERYQAGVYQKKYAVSSAKSCLDLILIPIDIQEHNELINKRILDLQNHLITE